MKAKSYSLDESIPYLMNRVIGRLNRGLDAQLRERGLGFQHWRVLAVLAMADDRPIADLAEYAVIPHSTLSRLLTRMERQGLVRRADSDTDLRLAKIRLTPKGAATYAAILPTAIEWGDVGLAGLARDDVAALKALLQRMLKNVDGAPSKPRNRATKTARAR